MRMSFVLACVAMILASVPQAPAPRSAVDQPFTVSAAGEAIAVVHASCAPCDWGVDGQEAAALRISVDGRYSQHLLLARGAEDADYHLTLGPVAAGEHKLKIEPDAAMS